MTEPSLIARQRAVLRDLIQRAGERARGEPAIAAALQEQGDAVEIEFTEGREAVRCRLTAELEENDRQIEQARVSIEARYKVEQDAANRELALAQGQILEREASRERSRRDHLQGSVLDHRRRSGRSQERGRAGTA